MEHGDRFHSFVMGDMTLDPSGEAIDAMDMDFSNFLDEIEQVASQENDGAVGAGSVDSISHDDSAFDSPSKRTNAFTGNNGGASLLFEDAIILPASSAPILDFAPIFEPQIRFGEIRSTPVQLPASSNADEGGQRRSSLGMRSQMKMMLQKQKLVEEEKKRETPNFSENKATSLTSLLTAGPNPVHNNNNVATNPIFTSMPRIHHTGNANTASPSSASSLRPVGPSSGPSRLASVSSSLPSHSAPLRLSNPTKLFFQKQQEYRHISPGSVGSPRRASGEDSQSGSPAFVEGNHLSVRPKLASRPSRGSSPALFRFGDGIIGGPSPATDQDICGSTGTSVSELDEIFEEIGGGTIERAQPEEVDAITGLLNSSMTMPQSSSFNDVTDRFVFRWVS